jgi:hypothetical protein
MPCEAPAPLDLSPANHFQDDTAEIVSDGQIGSFPRAARVVIARVCRGTTRI